MVGRRYGTRPSVILEVKDDVRAFEIDSLCAFIGIKEEAKSVKKGEESLESGKRTDFRMMEKMRKAGINPNDIDYYLDPNAKPNILEIRNLRNLKRKADFTRKNK